MKLFRYQHLLYYWFITFWILLRFLNYTSVLRYILGHCYKLSQSSCGSVTGWLSLILMVRVLIPAPCNHTPKCPCSRHWTSDCYYQAVQLPFYQISGLTLASNYWLYNKIATLWHSAQSGVVFEENLYYCYIDLRLVWMHSCRLSHFTHLLKKWSFEAFYWHSLNLKYYLNLTFGWLSKRQIHFQYGLGPEVAWGSSEVNN